MSEQTEPVAPGFAGEVSHVRVHPQGDPTLPVGPDLVRMAERALGYLARNPVEAWGWESRFSFFLLRCPPFAPMVEPKDGLHDPVAIGDTESRNDIAFNLMREMTGSKEGMTAQEAVHRRLVGYVKEGPGEVGDDLCWAVPYCMSGDHDGPYAMIWTSAKLLESESDLYRLTGEDGHRELARRLVRGLARVAQWEGERAFFPGGVRPLRGGKVASGYEGCYPNVLTALCKCWQACGAEEALELATGMAEGFVADLQPGHLHHADGHVSGHNHLQMHAVRGMAQLGALLGESRYLAWAQAAYDYYHANAFDTGWLPEILTLPDHRNHSETCLVADMLETALWLARGGRPELWDRVERTVRNYLVTAQFSVTPQIEAFWQRVHEGRPPAEVYEGLDALREVEGGFLGSPAPNDMVFEVAEGGQHCGIVEVEGSRLVLDMMGCCPPEGMRALYLAWANTVTVEPAGVFVNLPFDRDAPECLVSTAMPRRGRLQVIPKRPGDFYLRPPGWAPRDGVFARREGKYATEEWAGPGGAYLVFRDAHVGESLEVGWPLLQLRQRITQRFLNEPDGWVEGETFSFHWTGSLVTGVEPQGKWLPIYPGVEPLRF